MTYFIVISIFVIIAIQIYLGHRSEMRHLILAHELDKINEFIGRTSGVGK